MAALNAGCGRGTCGVGDMVMPVHVLQASKAAHDAVCFALSDQRSAHEVTPQEVAMALSHAYGAVLGLYSMEGAASEQIAALNRVATRAQNQTMSEIAARRAGR